MLHSPADSSFCAEVRAGFLAACSSGPAAADGGGPELDAVLARRIGEATAAYPSFAPPSGVFGRALARGLKEGRDPLRWLEQLRAADLWLATACEAGDAEAMATFERTLAPEIRRAAQRSQKSVVDADDLLQLVSQKLFVESPDAAPKIREYSGEGDLKGWVRVVAVRLMVDVGRKKSGGEAPASAERAVDALFAAGADPELEYLKRHYRAEFATAFTEAIASLDPEDRTSLRQSLVDGLTVDQIAHAHGVHRATAARRVQKAREALLSDTRMRLMARLRLSRNELESVMRMIESQLHVSVGRLLG